MRSIYAYVGKTLIRNLMLIAGLSIAVSMAIFISGVPSGNDMPQHFQFAQTFRQSLVSGEIYPSWSGATNYGFGDVGIRFYPPLAYYVLAGAEILFGSWFGAAAFSFCFFFFLSGVGIYFLCREFSDENASVFGAAVYILAPYHVNEIYNAFTLAEFAAAAVIPFCFLFVKRVCRGGGTSSILGLAAAYCALVLTHLPIAVIGSFGLLVFALFSLETRNALGTFARLGTSVALGLAASSFYWVRMVSELPWVKHSTQEFTSGSYDFHLNFLGSIFLLSSTDYDSRTLWFADLMLLITLGMFVPGLVLFLMRNGKAGFRRLIALTALLCFALFIATPLSLPVWENVGVLRSTQFPWRSMALITLCSAVFAAAGYAQIGEAYRSAKRPLALVATGLVAIGVLFSAFQVIRPAIFISPNDLDQNMSTIAGAKSYTCWWTAWADEAAFDDREKVSAAGRTVEIAEWQTLERRFSVEAGEPQVVRVATFYYPHWYAQVDDVDVPVSMGADGTINLPVPAGDVSVRLFFREPLPVRAANWISFLACLLMLAAALTTASRRADVKFD